MRHLFICRGRKREEHFLVAAKDGEQAFQKFLALEPKRLAEYHSIKRLIFLKNRARPVTIRSWEGEMHQKMAYAILERDDAVLLPGDPPTGSWVPCVLAVDVEFRDGLAPEDQDGKRDVVFLESDDGSKHRFEICPKKLDHARKGWITVGAGMVRYYPSLMAYEEGKT